MPRNNPRDDQSVQQAFKEKVKSINEAAKIGILDVETAVLVIQFLVEEDDPVLAPNYPELWQELKSAALEAVQYIRDKRLAEDVDLFVASLCEIVARADNLDGMKDLDTMRSLIELQERALRALYLLQRSCEMF